MFREGDVCDKIAGILLFLLNIPEVFSPLLLHVPGSRQYLYAHNILHCLYNHRLCKDCTFSPRIYDYYWE
uniref:Putative secreted protein n=1 Tax=Panstrongylus lignarius TaxID=156445 RepID=A0A224XUJ2_9HEMI